MDTDNIPIYEFRTTRWSWDEDTGRLIAHVEYPGPADQEFLKKLQTEGGVRFIADDELPYEYWSVTSVSSSNAFFDAAENTRAVFTCEPIEMPDEQQEPELEPEDNPVYWLEQISDKQDITNMHLQNISELLLRLNQR